MRAQQVTDSLPPDAQSAATGGRLLQLMLLTLASAAAIAARTALGPLQEEIRHVLQLSDNQIALLQGPAVAVPLAIIAVPLGLAIDRFSRVRLLLVLMSLNVLGSVVTALAPNFAMLLVARCVIGASSTPAYLIAVAVLADLYATAQRGRATMIVTVGAVLGMSGAFALEGRILGMTFSSLESWRWAMLLVSALLVLAALCCCLLREPPRSGVIIEKPSVRQSWEELARYRSIILPLVAGLALVVIADGACTIWAAPTLARHFGLRPERIGDLVALVLLISGIAGPLLGGFVADVCQRTGGPVRTLSALSLLALLSVPAGLFAMAPTPAVFTAALMAFMTFGVCFNVAVPALITIVLPNELRGTCLTLTSGTCMLCAFGIAPPAVSLLSGALGGESMLGTALAAVCVVASLAGAAIFALGRQSLRKKAGSQAHARQDPTYSV